MNINKYLAASGVCSRRKADELVKSGKVSVNGKVISEPFYKVGGGDVVVVNGKEVAPEKKVYILLNKPKGYITTLSDEKNRKTVIDLIDMPERVYPVGRLDRNTTGLLVLTNDGNFAQKLSHPKYEVEKVYQVTLDKVLKKEHALKLKLGIKLEDGLIKLDDISFNKKIVIVSLHSGRNRIVRRIFEHFDYKVVKLDRVSYAGITRKGLQSGRWRPLKKEEINKLRSI